MASAVQKNSRSSDILRIEWHALDRIDDDAIKFIRDEMTKQGVSATDFIAYMGTAFISYFGGNWELSKVKNDEAYGTPIINNWGNDGEPHVTVNPFVWTEIIRKRGKMERSIRQIFEGNINRFKH